MSEQKDVLLTIGLKGLVFSVCDKLLWNISVGNDVWTDVPTNYEKHWLKNALKDKDKGSVFNREAYFNVCKNTEIGDCCVAYLRLKCICEHKSLFLDRKISDLYIQLNLLCDNLLFYLFYQVVFNACNSLLSFIKSKKKTVSSNLDGTNLDKLKDLSESICCNPVFGKDNIVEYKCADLKVDNEPLWPLKIFKKLSSVIGMFTEPLFDDRVLEALLDRVKETQCYIKNISETHNKFRDLFKYEIIKSIQYDASTDAFSRTEPVFDESILTVKTLSYIEELLTSPNKTLVQEITSIKKTCDRKSVFKSKRLILKKSNKKNRKSNRKSKHKSNRKSKRKSARKL